jgi:putative acetyltransferase
MKIEIREIELSDNATIAQVIRAVLEEHDITIEGTAYHDRSLDNMYGFYSVKNSGYFIALANNKIVAGAGVYPTEGLPNDTCELVKMYVLKEYRGFGIAKSLLTKCLESSKQLGYKKMYLETLPELSNAVGMYQKFGFSKIDKPLGNTGHFACTLRMLAIIN